MPINSEEDLLAFLETGEPLEDNIVAEDENLPTVKFKVELDGTQRELLDIIVKTIKKLGDTPEGPDRKTKNRQHYIELIQIMLGIKQNFLKGNMYMFMTSGQTSDTLVKFYDPDIKDVIDLKLKQINFTFEGQDEADALPEEEQKVLTEAIKTQVEFQKNNPKALPTAQDILAARERLKAAGIGAI